MTFRRSVLSLIFCAAALLLSACGGIGTRVSTIPPDFTTLRKPMTLQRGPEGYDCGPEAVQAVFEYHGVGVPLADLIKDLYDPKKKGTLTLQVPPVVRRYGFEAILEDGSIGNLKRYIDAGFPPIIMVRFNETLAHFFVVSGYSDSNRQIVCEDYDYKKLLIPYDNLLPIWKKADNFFMVLRPIEDLLGAAERFASRNEHPKAIEFFLKHLDRDANSFRAHVGLGNSYLELAQYEKAFEHYRRAHELEPCGLKVDQAIDVILRTCKTTSEAVDAAHREGFDPKLLNGAPAALRNALDHKLVPIVMLKGEAHVIVSCDEAQRKMSSEGAEIHYDDWERAGAHMMVLAPVLDYLPKASRFEQNQSFEMALTLYLFSIRRNSSEARAHYGAANCFYALRQIDKAIDHYGQAHQLQPNDPEIQNNLANALVEAKRDLIRAEQLAGTAVQTFRQRFDELETKLRSSKREEERKELSQKFERTRRHLAAAYATLGQARAAQGKWEFALAAFLQSLETLPATAAGQRAKRCAEIAECYERLGMPDKAREYRDRDK